MARQGPIAKDTSTVALGLAQVRVGSSSDNINDIHPALSASDSLGSLANTRFVGNTDWYRLEGGYPLIEEYVAPIREAAHLECGFREVTPFNMALAYGVDPTDGSYSAVHSGEVALGNRTAPDYVRMEAVYTFPNGSNTMTIIFPRAQVMASIEVDLQAEDAAVVPITFEGKNASSDVTGGSSVWDAKPLGRIAWA